MGRFRRVTPVRSFTQFERGVLQQVASAIRAVEPDARIILYGSRARGDAAPESDWDFLVLLDGDVDRARRDRVRHALYDLMLVLDECLLFSSIVRSTGEWASSRYRAMPFRHNVEREGIPL